MINSAKSSQRPRSSPLQPTEASAELTAQVLSEAENLPTPVYFLCGAGQCCRSDCLGNPTKLESS
jgi:hypothetical protein